MVDRYNEIVDLYTEIPDRYNRLVDSYNEILGRYNGLVDRYNHILQTKTMSTTVANVFNEHLYNQNFSKVKYVSNHETLIYVGT